MAYGVSNGHVTDMTSRDPDRCCEAVRSAILATAWLLVAAWFSGWQYRLSCIERHYPWN